MPRYLCRLTLLAVLAACCELGLETGPDYRVWRVRRVESRFWPADGILRLTLASVRGDIKVWAGVTDTMSAYIMPYATGRDSADAEAYLRNVTVRDSIDSGVLYVHSSIGDPGPRDLGADILIVVPESVAVSISSAYGKVEVTCLSARLDVALDTGYVHVIDNAGSVFIRATWGNVTCAMRHLGPDDSASIECGGQPFDCAGRACLELHEDVSARFDVRTTYPWNEELVDVDSFPVMHFTKHLRDHKAGTIGAGEAYIRVTSENQAQIDNRDNARPPRTGDFGALCLAQGRHRRVPAVALRD